jgi:hypothetical protein
LTKKILIIGDMHVGSNVALMPEEVSTLKTEQENCQLINASPVQKKILKKWYEMIDTEGKVDALVVNGDIVDGYNRKGNGIGCWTTDMDTQMKTARSLIKEIPYRRLYGTQGSLYHTNENISVDKLVVESLGGTFSHDLALKSEGIRMHFSHKVGVSGSTWQYRTTPIAKEMVMNELNQMDFEKFKIIARNHAHYYCAVQFGQSLGLICPCWKGRDEFVKLIGLAFNPSIGYVVVETHGDTYEWRHNLMHLKGEDAIHTYNISMEEL